MLIFVGGAAAAVIDTAFFDIYINGAVRAIVAAADAADGGGGGGDGDGDVIAIRILDTFIWPIEPNI